MVCVDAVSAAAAAQFSHATSVIDLDMSDCGLSAGGCISLQLCISCDKLKVYLHV